MSKTQKPPEHLRKETAAWWSQVVDEFTLDDHHVRLLQLAAEAWDRGAMAREALAKHGMVYDDRFGAPRARPEVSIERDSRTAFCRTLRELALDIEAPKESRPPIIPANASLRVRD